MHIIVVDDERFILNGEVDLICRTVPDAQVLGFTVGADALPLHHHDTGNAVSDRGGAHDRRAGRLGSDAFYLFHRRQNPLHDPLHTGMTNRNRTLKTRCVFGVFVFRKGKAQALQSGLILLWDYVIVCL